MADDDGEPTAMAAARRRVELLLGVLTPPGVWDDKDNNDERALTMAAAAAADGGKRISIGEVSIVAPPAEHPELVPKGTELMFADSQEILRHLRWIMQKDLLGQDIFLLGCVVTVIARKRHNLTHIGHCSPPGPLRRQIVLRYCELTDREVEYVALSRDTTESDLKQRREISSSTALYLDQAAVLAAIHGPPRRSSSSVALTRPFRASAGRILIIEGIEKAERNVLPVLNNLLENREMNLEDGRFLVHPARYDSLARAHPRSKLDDWKLVRVSERFRVIALGLPVPRYIGNPLDPPLRSRYAVLCRTAPVRLICLFAMALFA